MPWPQFRDYPYFVPCFLSTEKGFGISSITLQFGEDNYNRVILNWSFTFMIKEDLVPEFLSFTACESVSGFRYVTTQF